MSVPLHIDGHKNEDSSVFLILTIERIDAVIPLSMDDLGGPGVVRVDLPQKVAEFLGWWMRNASPWSSYAWPV